MMGLGFECERHCIQHSNDGAGPTGAGYAS